MGDKNVCTGERIKILLRLDIFFLDNLNDKYLLFVFH